MRINLFEISSYHLIILLFPLFYRLKNIRNPAFLPSRFYYANYTSKNIIMIILVIINFGILVIRTALNASKLIDPGYFILQIIVLTRLFLQNYKEKQLGFKSPAYTFLCYFIINIIYMIICNVLYLFDEENCENYHCDTFTTERKCYSCRKLPMIANKLIINNGTEINSYIASKELLMYMWIFIEMTIVLSIFGIFSDRNTKKKSKFQGDMIVNSRYDQLELI